MFERDPKAMVRSARKQQQLKEREDLIIRVARGILLDRGYRGLTMDRIAASTKYSKGTIYQHFSCKEEILMAISADCTERHARLFERAATFRGRPRERMMAIGIAQTLYVQFYSEEFRASLVARMSSMREKTSADLQMGVRVGEQRCMGAVMGIIRDGIAQGDLLLDNHSPEDVCFGLWSMNFGADMLVTMDIPLNELGIHDPFESLRRNSQVLLDGYGWKPYTKDWDYAKTGQRIRDEVFKDEFSRL